MSIIYMRFKGENDPMSVDLNFCVCRCFRNQLVTERSFMKPRGPIPVCHFFQCLIKAEECQFFELRMW